MQAGTYSTATYGRHVCCLYNVKCCILTAWFQVSTYLLFAHYTNTTKKGFSISGYRNSNAVGTNLC